MFDYACARQFLAEKQRQREIEAQALWIQGREDCESIIAMIIRDFQPTRVIQWGSVLHPKDFWKGSDIDLAVEGVDAITFFQLFARAEVLTTFPLDLVRWENLLLPFQNLLLAKGNVVYAKY